MAGQRYNLTNIRTLLIEGFSDSELRRLCFDVPGFRPVYNELAAGTGKAEIVDRLLAYSERQMQMEALLDLARNQNPRRYNLHGPYSLGETSSEKPIAVANENQQQAESEATNSNGQEDRQVDSSTATNWFKDNLITLLSLLIAVTGTLAAIVVVPEVRDWLGLDTPPPTQETPPPEVLMTAELRKTDLGKAEVHFIVTSSTSGKQDLSSGELLVLKLNEVAIIATDLLTNEPTSSLDGLTYSYYSTRNRVPEDHTGSTVSYVAAEQPEADILTVSIKDRETGYEIRRSLRVIVEE